VEEAGHGEIVTDDFMNWRIKLEMQKSKPLDMESVPEPTPDLTPEPTEAAPEPAAEPTFAAGP
jgi:RAT1-interacting protein